MEKAITTKINNGAMTLPKEIRAAWQGARVLVMPTDDTLIIKRMEKPLKKLSDLANRVSTPPMTQQEIDKEIKADRKN